MRCLLLTFLLAASVHLAGAESAALWVFDDDPPGAVLDLGPGGLEGRAEGVEYVPGPGGTGLALHLSGEGARVEFPASEQVGLSAPEGLTIRLWLRAAAPGPAAAALEGLARDGTAAYRFGLDEAGRLEFSLAGLERPLMSRAAVTDGDWHYIAGAYEPTAGRAYLFVDDRIEAQAAALAVSGGAVRVVLGGTGFVGDLDDIEITRGLAEDLAGIIRVREQLAFLAPGAVEAAQAALFSRPAQTPLTCADLAAGWGVPDAPPDLKAIAERADGLRIALGAEAALSGAEAVGEPIQVEEYRVERVVLTTSDGVPVPLVLVSAALAEGDEPTPARPVLLLSAMGKQHAISVRWRLITGLVERGMMVAAADLRGIGELAGDWETPGRPLVAMQALDICAASAYLMSRPDAGGGCVACVGFGRPAAACLLGGVLDPRIARVVAVEGDGEAAAAALGGLDNCGVAGLAGALAPRPLWLQLSAASGQQEWVGDTYEAAGATASLLVTRAPPRSDDLTLWLTSGWE